MSFTRRTSAISRNPSTCRGRNGDDDGVNDPSPTSPIRRARATADASARS